MPYIIIGLLYILLSLFIVKLNFFLTILSFTLLILLIIVFLKPDIITYFITFYIYANLAVVAKYFYGVPHNLAASITLLLCIPMAHYLIRRREAFIINHAFLLMLGFLVVQLASSLFAKDMRIAGNAIGNFVLEGLVLYLLIINVIRNLETLRRVLWSLMLVGSLLGALSLYQAVTQSYENQFGGFATTKLIEPRRQQPRSGAPPVARRSRRAQGSIIGGPNRYAQIMLVLFPLGLFLLWTERSRWLRLSAATACFFILWGVLLSFSRGGFVTLVLLVLLLVGLRYIRPAQILIAVSVLLLLVALAAPRYFERIGSIAGVQGLYSQDASVKPDGSTRGRLTEMLAALLVFVDYPILGVGPGQYSPLYSHKYHLNPDIAFRHLPTTRRAHSLYLELAAETGLVGLTTFMAIVLWTMVRLWHARRAWHASHAALANLATAFWLSLFAYLASGTFLHLAYQRYYWFLLALAGATLHILSGHISLQDAPQEASEVGSPPQPRVA